MQLWNDYEGRTIAEAYPLNKLIRPEGRSAFFLTTNGTGTPAMLRLIEAHFDESEIMRRWQAISEIKQENLVVIRKFGETVLDGTPLVYAVMEPTDISLAELLENRTLNVDEARQLATSLVAALQALHQNDLVHEHIEPSNILAAGEVVKLRSDCAREVITDPEMGAGTVAEQKARDAHALAIVLLQALTGRKTLQGSATLLPTPFDGIIRNGLSGKWGLNEMAAALGPVKPSQVAAAVAAKAAPPQENKTVVTPAAKAATTEPKPAAVQLPLPVAKNDPEAVKVSETAGQRAPEPAAKPATPAAAAAPLPIETAVVPDVRHRIVRPIEVDPRRKRLWIVAAVGVVLLLLLFWRLLRSEPAANANAASQPISTLASPQPADRQIAQTPPPPAPKTKPSPAVQPKGKAARPTTEAFNGAPPPNSMANTGDANGPRTQWRVVAYTFNREDQAKQKADSLAKRDPSLNPQVFSPSGHAPYLVTLGGPMTREQAEALKEKARGAGLPRDTYAQNYTH
jgi:eukaryotic-like serine/threonine-protein kinase